MTKAQANLSPRLIRYVRLAMQMTQKEFGEYLGVDAHTVYRWEAGIHLPVGRRKQEIMKRYHVAKRHERWASVGDEVPGT